ncbi:MAG: insulinase family protein [Bdellovibrionales bacterium]|nr:insulinase family protein [Bdellovibrionales bacterium]
MIRNPDEGRSEEREHQVDSKPEQTSSGPEVTGSKLTTEQCADIQRLGFELIGETYRQSIDSQYLWLRHQGSGATIAIVQNGDPHLRSELQFVTLPKNSTGKFHKIEHGVISESGLIPVADVYDEMSSSLLLHEVNATTRPDRTNFFATGIDRFSVDLMTKVFSQAVLEGRPSEKTYLREHGHLRPDPDSPCGYKFDGVVQNEMRGYYASPRWFVMDAINAALYPGTPYAHSFGGRPDKMPELTLEQYQQIYDEFFSASQSFLGLYGNVPLGEKLALAAEILDGREKGDPPHALPEPVVFREPQEVRTVVPADLTSGVPVEKQFKLVRGWKCERTEDDQTAFEQRILSGLLSNSEMSPFNQALRQCGLGNVFEGCSVNSRGKETVFRIEFAQNTESGVDAAIEASQRLLEDIAANGFPRDYVEAIICAFEQHEKEANRSATTNEERLGECLEAAVDGRFAVDPLSFSERAEILRRKLDAGERVLETHLERCIVSNDNRVDITLEPSATFYEEWLQQQEDALAERVARMTPEERAHVDETAERMAAAELALEAGEDLSSVPKAKLEERYRVESGVPTEVLTHGEATILHNELDFGDQARVRFVFDTAGVSAEKRSLLEFLSLFMTNFGPEGYQPGQFASEVSRLGGSFNAKSKAYDQIGVSPFDPESSRPTVTFEASFDCQQGESFLDLASKGLRFPQFDNKEMMQHLESLISEYCQRQVNDTGELTKLMFGRLAAATSARGAESRAYSTEFALQTLEDIRERLASDPEGFARDLRAVHEQVFHQGNLTLQVACDADKWGHIASHIKRTIDGFDAKADPVQREPFTPQFDSAAYEIQSPSSYVGLAAQLRRDDGTPLIGDPVGHLCCEILNRGLTSKMRRLGGAYGANAGYNQFAGQMYFGSWQDPNIHTTLEAFRDSGSQLSRAATQDLLDRAKVAVMKHFESPSSAEDDAITALTWHLRGMSIDDVSRTRSRIMDATLEDVAEFAESLQRALAGEEVALRVYGNSDKLKKAKRDGEAFEIRDRFEG